MSLYQLLKARVDELSIELDKASEKAKKAQFEEDAARKKLNAFREALAVEMVQEGLLEPIKQALAEHASTNGGGISTTKFIKDAVLQSGDKGITAVEIKTKLQEAGIQAHPNYAYAVLIRARKNGELAKRNGRYYKKD